MTAEAINSQPQPKRETLVPGTIVGYYKPETATTTSELVLGPEEVIAAEHTIIAANKNGVVESMHIFPGEHPKYGLVNPTTRVTEVFSRYDRERKIDVPVVLGSPEDYDAKRKKLNKTLKKQQPRQKRPNGVRLSGPITSH